MPLDANGIHIFSETDDEPTFSDLLNLLGSSVSTKVAAMLSNIGTTLTAVSVADLAGVIGTDLVVTGAAVNVPAGTWLLHAGVSGQVHVVDGIRAAIRNVTAGAVVAGSDGPRGQVSAANVPLPLMTANVVVSPVALTTYAPLLRRNGASTPTAKLGSFLTAVRLK